jgi:diacylglycerol O-acyltransferase
MERLSGLDASFLYMETPSLHMHVSMAAIFDPSTVPGGYSFEKVRSLVSERLRAVPVFTRRLVEVPFRLDHPYWVDDPHFDLDYHLRRAALPSPGGLDELAEFVGDVCGRQLDRGRPLWEMYLVEGLAGDRIALVTKIHHCTIDGVSGAELLAELFDLVPDPPPRPAPEGGRASESSPSDAQLLAQALVHRLTRPVDVARLAWKTGRAVLDVRRIRQSGGPGRAALPLTAPRTSMNAAITPHRKVAFASIALEDLKRVKRATADAGTTINDAVLALCTGALRRYLAERGELPDVPLVATVPVSVRPPEGAAKGSNRVSAMFVALPTNIEHPIEQLAFIREGTKGAKEEHQALGADALMNWAEHATPNVFSAAARTYTRLKLADRHRPVHNLIISNVPGPDFPLYFGGAELVAGFPLGPITDGAGLNVTVMSYRGAMNWGFMACRETVPRVDRLAGYVHEALEELLEAAGLDPPTPTGVAPATLAKSPAAVSRSTRRPGKLAGTSAGKSTVRARSASRTRRQGRAASP